MNIQINKSPPTKPQRNILLHTQCKHIKPTLQSPFCLLSKLFAIPSQLNSILLDHDSQGSHKLHLSELFPETSSHSVAEWDVCAANGSMDSWELESGSHETWSLVVFG